ncbi:LytTR family DNA-binding domain-containing protein [Desulfosporosinus sp. OT]|uniref:LytR/AlgR family response regulator transcription factor n=1 Tax=Desulfosporosinus sp. OT TaxID=913865 RepID=UPI000223A67D|nr:LytTR family DNA-binding domain-containing protein [Desulfosporosinus sp. OT]EGW36400.1 response regulator [Desulfosporosinus sp. OT]
MRVMVVDDERPARDELCYLLREISGVEIVAQAGTGAEAIEKYQEHRPDAIFLDIQLPDDSGVDVARELIRQGFSPTIVFATAYDQYAVDAFDVNAVDYLLKPFHEDRLGETMQRLKKRLEGKNQRESQTEQVQTQEFLAKLDQIYKSLHAVKGKEGKLKIEENGKILLVPFGEILYATIEERSVRVVTRERSYLTNYTLTELEGLLTSSFLRVHKSYLAHLDQIHSIIPWFNNTYNLIMNNKSEIPVSRTYVKEFRERMGL